MKTCVWVLMCALSLTCLFGCSLLYFLGSILFPYHFHAGITVTDISEDLYWDATPADTLEYGWGARIDRDANAATGDPDGFDWEVMVDHVSGGAFIPHYNSWNDNLFQRDHETDDQNVTCNVGGNVIVMASASRTDTAGDAGGFSCIDILSAWIYDTPDL